MVANNLESIGRGAAEARIPSGKSLERSSDLPAGDVLSLTQQALAQLRESVVITDAVIEQPGPHIVYVNAAFTRMTGWLPEEVIGVNPRFLQGPKTTRTTLDRLRANLERGEAFVGEDINYRKDGSEFYIDWYIEPLRDAAGKIVYYVAVQRDVTERKLLEQQLLHAQRLEGIGLLASGIAHDMNNILMPMLIAPQILRPQLADLRDQKLLELVETSARRGVELLKQILAFARGTRSAAACVQPATVLVEVAEMARHTFPKTLRVVVDAPAETWPVEIDATQVYQLLLNLTVNARDAIAGEGIITLRAQNLAMAESKQMAQAILAPGRYAVLSVSDTGSGIPDEHLEKIFQPFFTSKEAGKGTGLGLSTAALVVKNARGALDVQTEVGRGTTFSAYLPATEEKALALPPEKHVHPSVERRSILLVDDEMATVSIAMEALKAAGYAVTSARSGDEARMLAARARFDLALVDSLTPEENAEAVVSELRAQGVPVISMSNSPADCAGSLPNLQKPFTLPELLTVVDQQFACEPIQLDHA